MTKAMVFIDGTWLYQNIQSISHDSEYRADFGKIPGVVCAELAKRIDSKIDIVRVNIFGSYATNYIGDARDDDAVRRRRDFFDLLANTFRFDCDVYHINFMQRALRRDERDVEDTFQPRETIAHIAMASSMVGYAATLGTFDVAVVIAGDQALRPAVRAVRQFSRRVVLASIEEVCSRSLSEDASLFDYDVIWMDDLVAELKLVYEQRLVSCESPTCKGPREVMSSFRPKRGQKFYCDPCRAEYAAANHRD